jgi:hypothetical protein
VLYLLYHTEYGGSSFVLNDSVHLTQA